MISRSKASEAYNVLNRIGDNCALKGTVKIHVSDEKGNPVGIMDLYEGVQIGRGVEGDSFLNLSLDSAKEIFSRLAAGDSSFKIAKIAFGNAGHSSTDSRIAVPPVESDTSLESLNSIMTSLDATDSEWFTRLEDGVAKRLVYIEKDIIADHISYGEEGNQFIVRVPISYEEFNYHDDAADRENQLAPFEGSRITYQYVKDGVINTVGNIDPTTLDKLPGVDHTEVFTYTDGDGNTVFTMRNGLAPDGTIDTTNGGVRPQEISEILLTTDIVGDGTTEPYRKLAASRMTSGLLAFPQGFQFTYEWTLTWNFN
jgi:hypothetical protein